MLVWWLNESGLAEDRRHVRFDRSLSNDQTGGDGPIGEAVGDEAEHLSRTRRKCVQWVVATPPPEQPGNDGRIGPRLWHVNHASEPSTASKRSDHGAAPLVDLAGQ